MTDPQPPDPEGWLGAEQAAQRLNRGVTYVATGHVHGYFPVTRHDGASWLLESDVDRILEQREQRRIDDQPWVTRPQVREWAGCSDGPVDLAIKRGDIRLRPGPRNRGMPSLDRETARAWTTAWAAEEAARVERARERAERAARSGPPDDEHVWLDTNTAAALADMKPLALVRLAQLGRAPATKHGPRWWWRRDLIEAYAAARVATHGKRRSPDGTPPTA